MGAEESEIEELAQTPICQNEGLDSADSQFIMCSVRSQGEIAPSEDFTEYALQRTSFI
jgi:hypothetical protein